MKEYLVIDSNGSEVEKANHLSNAILLAKEYALNHHDHLKIVDTAESEIVCFVNCYGEVIDYDEYCELSDDCDDDAEASELFEELGYDPYTGEYGFDC